MAAKPDMASLMNTRRLLSLSDAQLETVMAASASVPQAFRNRFLASIADELLPLPEIEDRDVSRAVQRVCQRMVPS